MLPWKVCAQLFLLFILRSESHSDSQCVLLSLPLTLPEIPDYISVTHNKSTLKLIAFNNELEYSSLVYFVSNVLSSPQYSVNGSHCAEVIGVIGDLDTETIRIIDALSSELKFSLNYTEVTILTPLTSLPLTRAVPGVINMNPLTHYIDALVSLTWRLNWTRIGLISDDTLYYQFTAELLQRQLHMVPYITLHHNSLFKQALETIQTYKTQIIIVSADDVTACSLLEEANKMGLNWPVYAWIILNSKSNVKCRALIHEGVLTIQDLYIERELLYRNMVQYGTLECLKEEDGCISSVMYDSLTAIALANEGVRITNASFIGRTGLIKFRNGDRLNNISIVQASGLEIANYDADSEQLMLLTNISGVTPRGGNQTVYNQITLLDSIFIVAASIFCFLLITVSLILFIIFRNEKEIKATSFTVSFCMYLGCYILLLIIPLLLMKWHPQSKVAVHHSITCNLLTWLGFTGLPFSLILSTILVKMLRVYAIFQHPFSLRKKLIKDYFLLIYISLLTSPSIIIVTLWSSTDLIIDKEIKISKISHDEIFNYCRSSHTPIWLLISMLYMSVLITAVIFTAIKTSASRFKHFRDAKATNAFASTSILIATMCTFYWGFFSYLPPSRQNYKSAVVPLYISHNLIAMLCQIFLFIPKVYPPMKRWLSR